jgi:exodeoxyribonuclease VII small subunit
MKSKRKTAEPVLNRNGLTFEQAIQRLEKIVADMEGAELPLEDVLKKYEEGSKLVRFCSHKLEEAEKKIEVLTKKTDGVAFEPFETEPKESNDADEENEGGKLF